MPRDRLLKRWLLLLTIVRTIVLTIVAAIVRTTLLTVVAAIVNTIFIGGWGEILNANTFLKIHSTLRLLNDFTGVMECGRGCSREEFESGVEYNRYNSYLSSHCHTNNNTTV